MQNHGNHTSLRPELHLAMYPPQARYSCLTIVNGGTNNWYYPVLGEGEKLRTMVVLYIS